ncbi:MAG: adenosylcobinamide-GDP ribazoletransferase [Roseobacter sp.]
MKTDTLKSKVTDVAVAISLLTRLPLPRLPDNAFENAARAVWAYPIVGAVLGVGAGAIGSLAVTLGLPVMIAAGLSLVFLACCTGAMHEDGLCDVADGFWGGLTRDKRLSIMKDSQIGTYGTLALILCVGLRWIAYAALLPIGIGAIFAAAALSRSMMPFVMCALPHARSNGLSFQVGRPKRRVVAIGVLFAMALSLATIGLASALSALLIGLLSSAAMIHLARRKIGGQTGDVLGATQVVTELCILCTILIVLN